MSTATMPPIEKSRREEFMMRLYGDLQIARFNEIYYQTRAQQARGWASRMNMLSAVASSGAFVGIIKPLPTIGPVIPPLLTAIAAVAAACGPFLGLDAKASQLERAAFGHGLIKDRIKRLLHDLKMKDLNYEHEARDNEIEHIRSSLNALDEAGSDVIRKRAWEQTLREFPSDSAWNLV